MFLYIEIFEMGISIIDNMNCLLYQSVDSIIYWKFIMNKYLFLKQKDVFEPNVERCDWLYVYFLTDCK